MASPRIKNLKSVPQVCNFERFSWNSVSGFPYSLLVRNSYQDAPRPIAPPQSLPKDDDDDVDDTAEQLQIEASNFLRIGPRKG